MMIAWIGVGIFSMKNVPIDAVPDITNNQVQIITTSPNLGTEDIEQFVTYPVELAMANLPGVNEIRSISRFGLSVVTVVLDDEMGTYLPRQLVSEKLAAVKDQITAELFYRVNVTAHLEFTPSVQFISNPTFNPDSNSLLYFGIRGRFTL